MDNRQSTININLGKLSMPPAASNYKQQDGKPVTFDSLEQLNKYINLKSLNRSNALHIFQDRYSILFMYQIKPGDCEYTMIHYNILDTTTDFGSYTYTTHYISDSNEQSCVQYIRTLRKLIGMNAPPNLALMHQTNNRFMCEIPSKILASSRFSKKNSRDIVFQFLFILSCMYSCDSYIDGINISTVLLEEPTNLIYKIGSIQFSLQDVLIVPIIQPISNSFHMYDNTSSDESRIKSYQTCCDKLRSMLSDDFAVPYIYENNRDINECIFSYLLMEYADESNLCSFEPMIEDLRVSSKYTNRACLSAHATRGNVYFDNNDQSVNVQLNTHFFYNSTKKIIEPKNSHDMTQMISIKEQQITTKQRLATVIRTFSFNGT